SVRLIGGNNRLEGRVEVFREGAWGTVCDDHWGMHDATVVCRMLGGYAATSAVSGGRFPAGSGPIWMDNVHCINTESDLSECPFNGWGVHDCDHTKDAGVICQRYVRLVGGSSMKEGRVEVLHNGAWGTVCDDSWDMNDARVVCGMLGYHQALNAYLGGHFPQGSGQIWLDEVACTGSESDIAQCPHIGWGTHNCGHDEDAGARCS
ncbi:predicted protein, partial [Nematostella vectensis]